MKKFVLNRARAARHDPFRSKRGSIPSDIIGELHHRSSYLSQRSRQQFPGGECLTRSTCPTRWVRGQRPWESHWQFLLLFGTLRLEYQGTRSGKRCCLSFGVMGDTRGRLRIGERKL